MVENIQMKEMDMNHHLLASKFKRSHKQPKPEAAPGQTTPLAKQSRSPQKKDLKIVQTSLENPLASYDSSRKSFTIDSPHFGLFREPATPMSLSKQTFDHHQKQCKLRTAHLLSFGAEEIIEESKLTFQMAQNESSGRFDLKFDSFQQASQPSFRKPPAQTGPSHLTGDKESIEEETGKDELKNQQSTSGPKDSDIMLSREEEEDIEDIIARASKRAFKRQGMGGILSAESSHQQSLQSDGSGKHLAQFSQAKIHISIPQLLEKHKASPSSELGKDLKNDMALYYSKLLERPSAAQESQITHKSSLNTLRQVETGLNLQSSEDGEPHSITIKKESLELPAGDNPLESRSRDKSAKKKVRKSASKSTSKTPKKKEKAVPNKSKEELFVRPSRVGHQSPRTSGSKRGVVPPYELTLKLDLTSLARSPKQTGDPSSAFSELQRSMRSSARFGITKSGLMSKIPRSGGQSKEKSMNISAVGKSSMLNCLETNRARTPLSKKELTKFMERRKLTSTASQVADNSSNLHCRSAIRLKAKRVSNSEMPLGEETNATILADQNLGAFSTVDLRDSKNSCLADPSHEKSLGKSQLRTSGDCKMGEKERARIRDMGDKHLEVSKTLTSRTKTATYELFADATQQKERPGDVTPERAKTSRKKLDREEDFLFPMFLKKSHGGGRPATNAKGDPPQKPRNVKVDIGNLSSKVLSMLPFDQ